MPKINPDEFLDWEDDEDFKIDEDDPVDTRGSKVGRKPPKQDLDWEEQRRRMTRKNRDWD